MSKAVGMFRWYGLAALVYLTCTALVFAPLPSGSLLVLCLLSTAAVAGSAAVFFASRFSLSLSMPALALGFAWGMGVAVLARALERVFAASYPGVPAAVFSALLESSGLLLLLLVPASRPFRALAGLAATVAFALYESSVFAFAASEPALAAVAQRPFIELVHVFAMAAVLAVFLRPTVKAAQLALVVFSVMAVHVALNVDSFTDATLRGLSALLLIGGLGVAALVLSRPAPA